MLKSLVDTQVAKKAKFIHTFSSGCGCGKDVEYEEDLDNPNKIKFRLISGKNDDVNSSSIWTQKTNNFSLF